MAAAAVCPEAAAQEVPLWAAGAVCPEAALSAEEVEASPPHGVDLVFGPAAPTLSSPYGATSIVVCIAPVRGHLDRGVHFPTSFGPRWPWCR